MRQLRLKEPETKSAILLNHAGVPTRHVFKETRAIRDATGNPIGVEDMFECLESGAVRRWGLRVLEIESGDN